MFVENYWSDKSVKGWAAVLLTPTLSRHIHSSNTYPGQTSSAGSSTLPSSPCSPPTWVSPSPVWMYWVLLFSLLCSARTTWASSTPTSRGRPRWTPRAAPRCPRASTWCSRGSPTWRPPSSRRCRRTSSDQEVFVGPVSDHFTGKLNNIFELKCPSLHQPNGLYFS